MEALGIIRQVVGYLVLRQKSISTCGKAHSRKSRIPCRSKQAEGVPPVAPCVSNVRIGIENYERKAPLRQVISDRQAGLAPTDHNRLNSRYIIVALHIITPTDGRFRATRY